MKFALLISFIPLIAYGYIFEYKANQGIITYSDRAPLAHQALKCVKPLEASLVSIAGQPLEKDQDGSSTNKNTSIPKTPASKSIAILSPVDQQTFWNVRSIPITVSSEHNYEEVTQVLVDGIEYNHHLENGQTVVNDLDRGSHSIQAQILDKEHNVLTISNKVTIHIHYGTNSSE